MLAASVLATLANPFGWHIYRAAYDLATQGGALNKVSSCRRYPSAGPWTIRCCCWRWEARQRWRGGGGLCCSRRAAGVCRGAGVPLAARRVGDGSGWALILASTMPGSEKAAMRLQKLGEAAAALAAVLIVTAGFCAMQVNDAQLETQLAKNMPVDASEGESGRRATRGHSTTTTTGADTLIWALRMPVSIDGRQNLYETSGSTARWRHGTRNRTGRRMRS